VHAATLEGETIQELCVATTGDVGVGAGDADTLQSAMNMFRDIAMRMVQSLGAMADSSALIPPIPDGIPVEVRDLKEGTVHRLAGVSDDTVRRWCADHGIGRQPGGRGRWRVARESAMPRSH
jgi:hypothetical protein